MRLLPTGILLAFTCIAPAVASAADRAELLIREAVELRKAGKDAQAAEKLERAYEMAHTPRAAAQLGLCEQALERWVPAELHLAEAITAASDPWIARNRQVLETSLSAVRARLVRVEVSGKPDGAVVRVNDQLAGKLPRVDAVHVLPGEVAVVVSATGYLEQTVSRVGKAGQVVAVDVSLQPSVTTNAPAPVEAAMSATDVAAAPPPPSRIDEPSSGWTWQQKAALGAFTLGGASLVLGVISHVQRESAATRFREADGCDKQGGAVVGGAACESIANDFDGADVRMKIGYVGAGVLGLTGGLLLLLSPSVSDRGVEVACAPQIAGSLGLACGGTF